MRSNLYLAYGANMNADSMAWRCPQARAVGAFVLRDWQLKLYCHATIEPVAGSCVGGVMWDITDQCEANLDKFEGFPHYYAKRTWLQDGVQFFFYEMTAHKSGQASVGYVQDIETSHAFWDIEQAIDTCN